MPEAQEAHDVPPAAEPPPVQFYTYRLATHPNSGEHGYEVGIWPAGADLNDPAQYQVVGIAMDQMTAAAMAMGFQVTPPAQKAAAPPAPQAEPEEEEHHSRSGRRHRL